MTGSHAVADLLAEKVNYGGIVATRAQVYADVQRIRPNGPVHGIGSADWWAFSRPRLDPQQESSLIPWGIVCLDCHKGHMDHPLPDQERSLCADCSYGTPCLICGAPVNARGEGHDDGCMGVSA